MVSIVITTYNYGRYVERAIRSAFEQSLDKSQYEIIVVNDASTDRTSEILKIYEDKTDDHNKNIHIFNMDENLGLSGARNFGIKKAKGQFVIFLDADDYIHRDLLKTQKLFLEENNALDAISCDYYLVDERGTHLKHVSGEKNPIACGIMFRKDFLYDIGLYDTDFRAREEQDLRKRWASKFNIYNLVIPLYRYRMHDSNLTKNEEEMDKYQDLLVSKHGNKD